MKQIVLHGGVGNSSGSVEALEKYATLSLNEKTPLDAVVAAVTYMEDDPNFNAGTGSAMRLDGSIQMDASCMMNGSFGAVINIESVKNPVKVARDVMKQTNHCILSGDGAVTFARKMGYPFYDPSTDKSRKKLEKLKEIAAKDDRYRFSREVATDTVGAVADFNGVVASALSTGGNGKIPMLRGRVGDTPIPGAGILVMDEFGIAATGGGEEIIRKMLSYRLFSKRESLQEEWKLIAEKAEVSLGVIGFNHGMPFSFSNRPMPYWYAKGV
ncbi:MAG: isoaspartyl peptidase/L-asparaginase [Thermoplasmatales archaeon]|nr:isoaspartyl peptidase/L-asparaginase [Thermoplasmatales archaeon]